MTTRTAILRPSQLVTGNVANEHGMRCYIDRPISSRTYGEQESAARGGQDAVYWTNALVLNRADVSSDSVPLSFTSTASYPSRGMPAEPEGTHRWLIQGNDLRTVVVEHDSLTENQLHDLNL